MLNIDQLDPADPRPAKHHTAADLRWQARERARMIAALGMEPEDGTADGRYAATSGEMRGWLMKDGIAGYLESSP